jgi:hypothetical protein
MAEHSLDIPAAAHHTKNHHICQFEQFSANFALDAVDNNVLSDWEAAHAGAQILVAGTAQIGGGRKNRPVMESIRRSAMSVLPLFIAT